MIIIGFVLLAVAVAAAIVAIAQNQSAMLDVRVLGYDWHGHAYWVLVAGLVIAAVGFVGIAIMRSGAIYGARRRTEQRGLAKENARLNRLARTEPATERTMPVAAAPVAQGVPSGPVGNPEIVERPLAPMPMTEEPAGSTATPRRRPLFNRTRHV